MCTQNLALHPVPTTDTRVVRKYNKNIHLRRQTDMSLSAIIVELYSKVEYKRYCIIFNGQFRVYLIELLPDCTYHTQMLKEEIMFTCYYTFYIITYMFGSSAYM